MKRYIQRPTRSEPVAWRMVAEQYLLTNLFFGNGLCNAIYTAYTTGKITRKMQVAMYARVTRHVEQEPYAPWAYPGIDRARPEDREARVLAALLLSEECRDFPEILGNAMPGQGLAVVLHPTSPTRNDP